MLQAQVNYWNLQEQKRHNLVSEGIDTENAQTNRMAVIETTRHNVATETLGFQTLAETQRHNLVTESQGSQSLNLRQAELDESIRSHKANEAIAWSNVGVAEANANTNRLNAQISSQRVSNDYALGKYSNYTNRLNAYSNQQNANSNTSNAKQKITETVIKEKEYNLKEADTKVGWFSNLLGNVTKLTQ